MMFDQYLVAKKIDAEAFRKNESLLFEKWKNEFEQMHANSFTAQKLYLINPIRRKYPLKSEPILPATPQTTTPVSPSVAKPARPVMKPKPKIG